MKAIYYYNARQYNDAKACYEYGISMFDGYGFKDEAFYADGEKYTTYKLALWKIAADITGYGDAEEALQIIALMQDPATGGVYTHYKKDMSIDSMTNVETTALAIIASNSRSTVRMVDGAGNALSLYTVIAVIVVLVVVIIVVMMVLRRR